MKVAPVLGTVLAGVVLQAVLARYMAGGRWSADFVLVAVVYASLYWGAGAGVIGGTVGGLAQDAISGTLLGVHGLADTIVGYTTGALGAQFIVTKSAPRLAIAAGATLVQRALVVVLFWGIHQRWSGVPWGAILGETAVNALAAFLAFQLTESLPGSLRRRRMQRRSSLSRRQW